MSYPTYETDNGVGITNIAGDTKIGVGINGLEVEYDIGTPSEKKFIIRPAGVEFLNNGITSYTTGLERLCAVQQAFQAVELPPNSTTLEVNKQLNLDDQLGNIGSIGLNGVNTEITATGDLILNPTGSIETAGKKINMVGGEIDQVGKIVGKNNTDIELDARGTGDLLIKTATITRLGISDTGDWTIAGGVGTSGQVLASGGAGVSPSWTTIPAGGASIDITDTNTSATYYPTFVDSAGTGKVLRADTTTTPWSINPNTGVFNFANTLSVGGGASSNNTYIGRLTGTNGTNITAVGQNARGANNGGVNGTAVGVNAGYNAMGDRAVCIGAFAGNSSTGVGAVCLGYNAGGSFSVPAGNIIIDADLATNITASGGTNRFFVNPIRNATQTTALGYDATTKEITYYTPNPNITQTEDFIAYSVNPQITASTGGIIGTEITFDIFNNSTGTSSLTQNYTGGFNANLLSGSLQRRGYNHLYAGVNSSSQQFSQQKYSFTNINKITWGFVPLGDGLISTNPVTGANITYVLGLVGTRAAFAEGTSNSICWTMDGVNGSGRGVETGFKFVINNVVQYSLVMNGGNMLNRWCRAGFTSTYVSGNTTAIQGFWTDLSTGLTETTAVYTITGGTGFVNPITSPNSCGIFQSAYSNSGNRYFLIDYCEVQQNNLYQIGVGSTQITGR